MRLTIRVWGFAALGFAAALLAGASHAQPAPRPSTWVYKCQANARDGYPAAETPVFAVQSPDGRSPDVEPAWRAWLRANRSLRYDGDARCYGTTEAHLPEIQGLLVPLKSSPTFPVEYPDWRPDFAVAYQFPREIYYYCSSSQQGLQRRFVSDLFKAPMPANLQGYLYETELKHSRWLQLQGLRPYGTNAVCTVLVGEPYQLYAETLDVWSVDEPDPDRPFHLVHSAWPGVDPAAAPNLVDDLAARAKYAKLSIAPPKAVAKVAPPPTPKRAPAPPPRGSLEIKTDTSAKDAAKAWDEQVKKTLAAEAQKKVETAAKAVQADAEFQAKMRAFWAERRRRGNAQ